MLRSAITTHTGLIFPAPHMVVMKAEDAILNTLASVTTLTDLSMLGGYPQPAEIEVMTSCPFPGIVPVQPPTSPA